MKKIIIFGMGQYTERNWERVRKEYDIVAVLDNKVEKGQNYRYKDVKAYNPNDFDLIREYPILVLVHKYVDIINQLKHMGVFLENIWVYCVSEKSNIEYVTASNIYKIIELPDTPISVDWGYRRGTPVGRIFIDKFLAKYSDNIWGNIMEVAETTYSKKYSNKNKNNNYTAIHIDGVDGCRKANLETGEGLNSEEFDTMIITQTLAYIYDLKAVVKNIYNSLKTNGNCFVTVSDIAHMGPVETENYGAFWGFHKDGCKRLFAEVFGKDNVVVEVYGNIKTATAQMYGIAAEDLNEKCFEENDYRYPVIIGIFAHKE